MLNYQGGKKWGVTLSKATKVLNLYLQTQAGNDQTPTIKQKKLLQ